jgi:hypothetical protein
MPSATNEITVLRPSRVKASQRNKSRAHWIIRAFQLSTRLCCFIGSTLSLDTHLQAHSFQNRSLDMQANTNEVLHCHAFTLQALAIASPKLDIRLQKPPSPSTSGSNLNSLKEIMQTCNCRTHDGQGISDNRAVLRTYPNCRRSHLLEDFFQADNARRETCSHPHPTHAGPLCFPSGPALWLSGQRE